MKLIPVNEYPWNDDYSFNRILTCQNHQTARYLSKHPWARGLHVAKLPEGDISRTRTGECTCKFDDLAVIVED